MGPTGASIGPKTLQRTFELRDLLLTRVANIALLPVMRKVQMGSLANLLLLLTFLGRVGGQVALPDGKTIPSFSISNMTKVGVYTKFP